MTQTHHLENHTSIAPASTTNTHSMMTRRKNDIFKHVAFFINYLESEPPSAREALKHPHWHKVMQEEYKALTHNKTWELVPLQRDQKSCRL